MKMKMIPVVLMLCACTRTNMIKYEYGVFLGLDSDDTDCMEEYRIIVLDAQYFDKEQIQALKKSGHTVYSYINLGSLENFRPYYDKYSKYTLEVYENWEDERWVDVSAPEWQTFMQELAVELTDKGCDGLFVDNTDVYYHYPTEDIFDGVTAILRSFREQGAYISINGGDAYVSEYADRFGDLDIIDAVNQETVFSAIDFDSGTFSRNDPDEQRYFTEYTDKVSSFGKDVYLLEYTSDKALINETDRFCKDRGYRWYASQTLELLYPSADGSQRVIE